jgi:Zn finger protein HypA/HybF involved in hydrogenase expression
MLDVVLEKAEEAHASKITAINLVVGDMASIVDDCVQFYFDFGGCFLLSSSAHAVKMS